MKVIVCGSRKNNEIERVVAELNDIDQREGITHVIHGAAQGVDTIAAVWAVCCHKEVTAFPADWDEHGRKAGYIRNLKMAKQNPDKVIAFKGHPGHNAWTRGTKMMVDIATDMGIEVIKV